MSSVSRTKNTKGTTSKPISTAGELALGSAQADELDTKASALFKKFFQSANPPVVGGSSAGSTIDLLRKKAKAIRSNASELVKGQATGVRSQTSALIGSGSVNMSLTPLV